MSIDNTDRSEPAIHPASPSTPTSPAPAKTPTPPRHGTTASDPRPRPRQTRQRQLISQVLENQTRFRTAQQLHADLDAAGETASLATVYRVLQSLAEHGSVDTWRTPGGELAYRHCSPAHHHHLICYRCGRTVEIKDGPAEQWAAQVAAENGFIHAQHQVEVYGLCPQCAAELGALDDDPDTGEPSSPSADGSHHTEPTASGRDSGRSTG